MLSVTGLPPGARAKQLDPRPWQKMHDSMHDLYQREGIGLPEPGEWVDEPDDIQWTDETTGYNCWMKRSPMGSWNAYVCVPADHPWWGMDYDQVYESDHEIDVHGGLTFADSWLAEGDWWFGFDCGHAFDQSPAMPAMPFDTYRTAAYVVGEVTSLALQLAAVHHKEKR